MKKDIIVLIDKARAYKKILVPSGEALIFIGILGLSYYLRLGSSNLNVLPQILFLAAIIIPLKIIIFWMFRLYHISFRYTSVHEMVLVVKAASLCALLFALISLILRDIFILQSFPRSIIFIDFLLTAVMSSSIRVFFRLFYFPYLREKKGRNTLIVGAGSAGAQLVQEMLTSNLSTNTPVAFIDDDPNKTGMIIHGIKVEGGSGQLQSIVEAYHIEEIVIAMPSASSAQLREIMAHVRNSGINNVKILPRFLHILTGDASMGDIRQITVEDLLGREPVTIDLDKISSYLTGKSVLITGAAGSIGSELCRQIASFKPSLLLMVDMGETELFFIDREIRERFPEVSAKAIIADVKDVIWMKNIFLEYLPQIVFHAAAYKHVPLMETNLREAVLNNVGGTKTLATLSVENNTEKFVFISTDKAVNPTSIMGATKRIAENLLRCCTNETCKFISVRFGNVLESRGSVVPIFKEQIRNGRPITITHPEMKRYLMSITEAVQLVLQAGFMGSGGEVFVLDMGEPIKILDLAKEMIRLSGLEPDKDIPIVFTGIRPGEKLFEELLTAEEGTKATKHEKIFIAAGTGNQEKEYIEKVDMLLRSSQDSFKRQFIMDLLKTLVPTYQAEEKQK